MRLAWLTDLHLNFLYPDHAAAFFEDVLAQEPDALLISGDITDARQLIPMLRQIDARLGLPLYFVLGNHDYYHGSFQAVRAAVSALAASSPTLTWLNEAGVVPLTNETALVGHDGWGDARLGNVLTTEVVLNDFLHIEELHAAFRGGRTALVAKLNALGDEAAAHLRHHLPAALATHRRVIVVTHVPPFREACWHEGGLSDDDFLPYFACQATGDVLREVMAAHPEQEALVLCGHSHGAGAVDILPNLRVLTGGAIYGSPEVQRIIEG